jgi:nucleolin
LYNFFQNYGTVTKARVLTHKDTGKSKGIGFVEFSSNEECKAALDDAENICIHDRTLQVNYSGQKDANAGGFNGGNKFGGNQGGYGGNQGGDRGGFQSRGGSSGGDKFTAFVGNLPFKINDTHLRKFFKNCGNILEVRIATDRDTGKMKGFGHVDFETNEGLQKAMELNGQEMEGRPLKVDASTAKSGGGSGGRGGFGGGRGGGRGGFGGGRGGGRGGYGDPMARAQKSGAMISGAKPVRLDEDDD